MPEMVSNQVTTIRVGAELATTIGFCHVDESDQNNVAQLLIEWAELATKAPGNISTNVLRSLEGTRLATYFQWESDRAAQEFTTSPVATSLIEEVRQHTSNDPQPRHYSVVYADDRSDDRVSVIGPSYSGAIFINEISTQPATQRRLLELVIANNEIQSLHTPGYRSANFHRSSDGERAVNYSLWGTADECIEAISAMADMDENLEETVQIASPDFRFYELIHATHI